MAAEQLPGGPASIALVDLSYLFRKTWHSQARDSLPGDAAQATLNQLAAVRESVEHVIICVDSPPYLRREIDPEYKAQREKPADEMLAQMRWTLDRIDKEGYQIARSKGHEADDCIATLARAYGFWCPDVRIVSSDKDCAQCVTETVRMFVPAVGSRPAEIRGPAEVKSKYGVLPKDMVLWLALCGDDGDNVKGIPGVGPKKAAAVIDQCGSLAGIKQALVTTEEGEKPSAMWTAIGKHFDVLERALKLVELRTDVPIDVDALLGKKERETISKPGALRSEDGVPDADWDPISRAPEGYVAPAAPASEAKTEAPKAAASVPRSVPSVPATLATTALTKYGLTDADLQPLDLVSARNLALWFFNSDLYSHLKSPEAVLTVMIRGREMGIKATTALAAFHVIEGKPSASADLLHSLAERSPKCKYFRMIESSATSATWETWHVDHPEPTRYTYTIAEAEQAGLLKPSRRTGEPSNWIKRPRDLCSKTAKAKLSRLVYPGDTLGLYAPEEMSDD